MFPLTILEASRTAFALGRYPLGTDVQKHDAVANGYPETFRQYLKYNGFAVASGACSSGNQATWLGVAVDAYQQLLASATNVDGGLETWYSSTDDAAHSSIYLDSDGFPGAYALLMSGIDDADASNVLGLMDRNIRYWFDPANYATYQTSLALNGNKFDHRYAMDTQCRARMAYAYPSSANTAALAASVATLEGLQLPAGWQIATVPGMPGVLIAPGGAAPTNATRVLSAAGMFTEACQVSGAAPICFDAGYSSLLAGYVAVTGCYAAESGDTATATAMIGILGRMKPGLLARIPASGIVDASDSGRLGYEFNRVAAGQPEVLKTYDYGDGIFNFQIAYALTGDADWLTMATSEANRVVAASAGGVVGMTVPLADSSIAVGSLRPASLLAMTITEGE
jgi:hypothetical protein